jgi:6-phosphogluconate dehydrogenase
MNRRSALIALIAVGYVPGVLRPQEVTPSSDDDGWKIRDQQIQLMWKKFCDLLRSGDLNSAMLYFTEGSRARYLESFRTMGDSVRSLPDNWSELKMIEEFGNYASYSVIRTKDGNRRMHMILFVHVEKGEWLLSSL